MGARAWNHNIHYHDLVLRSVPSPCHRALDVGCGLGLLAQKLSTRCGEVVAIDSDRDAIARARAANPSQCIQFVEGDVMTYPFAEDSFDMVVAVASLHHLPLRPALERFRKLVRSGGVLVVIGLFRARTLQDYAWSAMASFPASWTLRLIHGHTEVGAPVQDPKESLVEIRRECRDLLPGCVLQRRLLFRYSLIWRKPSFE